MKLFEHCSAHIVKIQCICNKNILHKGIHIICLLSWVNGFLLNQKLIQITDN